MTILSVSNLSARYGQLNALRHINFDIEEGEVVALIGANGAGKTTMLRTIAGSHADASGVVRFCGADIGKLPAHQRVAQGIALVQEGRRLFADMTVAENLRLGAISGRQGEWTVKRVLDLFPNLSERLGARTRNLSGGEQQATAIGRALMANPDLLILDEVSLGLSPMVVDQVYTSIDRLLASGVTVILVEQDLNRAMRVASRAVCMLEGEIVLDLPMEQAKREQITDAYFGIQNTSSTGSDSR